MTLRHVFHLKSGRMQSRIRPSTIRLFIDFLFERVDHLFYFPLYGKAKVPLAFSEKKRGVSMTSFCADFLSMHAATMAITTKYQRVFFPLNTGIPCTHPDWNRKYGSNYPGRLSQEHLCMAQEIQSSQWMKKC